MYINIKSKVLLQIYHCMYASNVSKETCEIHKEYLNVKWYSLPVRYIQSIVCRECLSHPPFFVEVFVPAHLHVLHNAALDGPQCGKGQAGLQHHLLHHRAVVVVPVALITNMIIRD